MKFDIFYDFINWYEVMNIIILKSNPIKVQRFQNQQINHNIKINHLFQTKYLIDCLKSIKSKLSPVRSDLIDVYLTMVSGRLMMDSFSCSSVDRVSGRYRAREKRSSEAGMFLSRWRSSHCCSWLLRRPSDTPRARIPRSRLAAWSSGMVRLSTPSC